MVPPTVGLEHHRDGAARRQSGAVAATLTALELIGADHLGLLSEVFAMMADLRCNVVEAKVAKDMESTISMDEDERDDFEMFLSMAPQNMHGNMEKASNYESVRGFKETVNINEDAKYVVEVVKSILETKVKWQCSVEMPLNTSEVQPFDTAIAKHGRPPLDIALNVHEERVHEDMVSQSSPQTTGSESEVISNRDVSMRSVGGLDLDLDKADEVSAGFPSMFRDFDLNNGP